MRQPIVPIMDTPQIVVKGDTWQWGVFVSFDSKTTDITPEDITAVDVTVKTSRDAEDYVLHHDLIDGGIEANIDGDDVFYVIRFSPEEMEKLSLGGEYYYDCQLTYGENSDIKTIVRGRLTISYEVRKVNRVPMGRTGKPRLLRLGKSLPLRLVSSVSFTPIQPICIPTNARPSTPPTHKTRVILGRRGGKRRRR